MAVPTRPIARRISRSPVRPITRGLASFNPVRDLGDLAFYYDLQAADSAYETLPGFTLATAQNDGIGAVLDLKRYKERGAELVTTPEIEGLPISDPEDTTTAAVYQTGATVEVGKLYEIEFTVAGYAGTGSVGISSGPFPLVSAIRPSADATYRFIGIPTATSALSVFTRKCNTANFSGISVREIPGYHATQDVAANQPVLNIENGIRSALFDGVDDRLVIPNSKSAFNFLHDGTGGEIHVCARLDDVAGTYALASNWSGSQSVGAILRVENDGRLRFQVTHGVSGESSTVSTSTGAVAAGEKCVLSAGLVGEEMTLRKNGVLVASGSTSHPLSSADSSNDFLIGMGTGAGTYLFKGDIYSIAPIQGALTDYDRQRLISYMLRRAGI